MITNENGDYMTAEEAAAALGVKVATLYAYVSRGLVQSYRQGIRRRRLYRRADIAALGRIAPAREERNRLPRAEDWIPLTG
jgi:excisionase family DNA binding protein